VPMDCAKYRLLHFNGVEVSLVKRSEAAMLKGVVRWGRICLFYGREIFSKKS